MRTKLFKWLTSLLPNFRTRLNITQLKCLLNLNLWLVQLLSISLSIILKLHCAKLTETGSGHYSTELILNIPVLIVGISIIIAFQHSVLHILVQFISVYSVAVTLFIVGNSLVVQREIGRVKKARLKVIHVEIPSPVSQIGFFVIRP